MEEYTDISVTMHTQRSTVRQTIRHNTCTSLTASITYIITYSHSHLLAIRVQLLFIQYFIVYHQTYVTGGYMKTWNLGPQNYTCQYCSAILRYEERTDKRKKPQQPKYAMCCM